jgi:hypothetical protein
VVTGKELLTLEQQVNGIAQIQFSPDDKTLAVSAYATKPGETMAITLWNTAEDVPARAEITPAMTTQLEKVQPDRPH